MNSISVTLTLAVADNLLFRLMTLIYRLLILWHL